MTQIIEQIARELLARQYEGTEYAKVLRKGKSNKYLDGSDIKALAALTEALTRVEKLEKYKSPQQWAKLKSEVTAYRNEAEQSRVLLDQADTREKIAVSDIYDRDNIIRDLLKKVRDHEARIEELEGALAKIAANKHRPISLMSMPPIDQRAQWAEDALRRTTLSKGITE